MNALLNKLLATTSLRELCDALNAAYAQRDTENPTDDEYTNTDFSYLPTFGGPDPRNTLEKWSWDETDTLVQTHLLGAEWSILPRKEEDRPTPADFELIAADLTRNCFLSASVWESGGPVTCIAILGKEHSFLFGTADAMWAGDVFNGCGVDSGEPVGYTATDCPTSEQNPATVADAISRAVYAYLENFHPVTPTK